MNGFDAAYGEGATEKFRAAAEVEPFDQVELEEIHPGILRFRMYGPEARGFVTVGYTGDGAIEWSQMDLQPSGTGILGRLSAGWGYALTEIGVETMRIAGTQELFSRIGFDETGTCPVSRLLEYSKFRSGGPEPGWR